MTITNGYCTLAELKHPNRLNINDSDSVSDDMLEGIINTASRDIDNTCHRFFYADTDSDPVDDFYYTAKSPTELFVDDIRTLTGLTISIDNNDDGEYETTFDSSDVSFEPANASSTGRPYQKISIRARSGKAFPVGVINGVKVSAHFGWPSVPPGINQGTLLWAERLFKRGSTPIGSEAMSALGKQYLSIPSEDPDVMRCIGWAIKPVWG